MTAKTLWARWKRLAHRAAEIQSFVILTVLYWLVVAPIGLLSRSRGEARGWHVREAAPPTSVEAARRQY
jgi:hypothetical protein